MILIIHSEMIKKYLSKKYSSETVLLNNDVVLKICEKLSSDKEKVLFLSTSVSMNKLKHQVKYVNKIHVYRIMNVSYFDNFEYVKISQYNDICPKNTRHVQFCVYSSFCRNKICFPEKMTHLTFDDNFDSPINFTIPSTVTHLTFGRKFNQKLKHMIPLSVSDLKFTRLSNKETGNILPESITHLTLGENFSEIVHGYELPSSIIEITFNGPWFYFYDISSNVKIVRKKIN
uniref:FNIP repeat-containing protein n=1 Tax=viral metagenome TaxID=1070528 RepID=A0A6C0C7S5_9ZZZZ